MFLFTVTMERRLSAASGALQNLGKVATQLQRKPIQSLYDLIHWTVESPQRVRLGFLLDMMNSFRRTSVQRQSGTQASPRGRDSQTLLPRVSISETQLVGVILAKDQKFLYCKTISDWLSTSTTPASDDRGRIAQCYHQ